MLTRRGLLATGAAAGFSVPAQALVPTPRQTTGPFYPDVLPPESDFDLVTMAGKAPATGEVIGIEGRVLDIDGRPVRGAVVELWQANAYGRYAHSGDRSDVPLDPNFQGYGVVRADDAGRYRFRTIRPGLYSGRTRHVHFSVRGPGFEDKPMQMYFAGEAGNTRDFLYAALQDHESRQAVTVDFVQGSGAEPIGIFDIVVG